MECLRASSDCSQFYSDGRITVKLVIIHSIKDVFFCKDVGIVSVISEYYFQTAAQEMQMKRYLFHYSFYANEIRSQVCVLCFFPSILKIGGIALTRVLIEAGPCHLTDTLVVLVSRIQSNVMLYFSTGNTLSSLD